MSKSQNFTQNQVFEQRYLTYLRQLSKESAKLRENQKTTLLQSADIDGQKDQPFFHTNQFLKDTNAIKLKYQTDIAIEKVFQGISKFEDVIDLIKKNLYIDQNTDGIDKEVVQSTRRQYFQTVNQQQYSLNLEYPIQIYENYVHQCPYFHSINTLFLNHALSSQSMQSYNAEYTSLNNVTEFMQSTLDQSHSSLIKQDQKLKFDKNSLTTIKSFIKFISVRNKSSLLSLYRFLISLQNNILFIVDSFDPRAPQEKNVQPPKKSEVFEILEESFCAALTNKNLQSLKITSMSSVMFESFLSALTNVDLSQSNLRIVSINVSNLEVEDSQIQIFFQCLNELHDLRSLEVVGINVESQETLDCINTVLKKLNYLKLEMRSVTDEIDLKLNLGSIQQLKLTILHKEQKLSIQQQLNLFSSISQSQVLKYIECIAWQEEEEEKDESKLKQEKNKNKKAKQAKNQNQKVSGKSSTKKEEVENYELKDQELLKLFSKSSPFEFAYFNLRYNPLVYKILLLRFKNSSNIKRFKMSFKKELIPLANPYSYLKPKKDQVQIVKEIKQSDQEKLPIDLKDLYEILNNAKVLDAFSLNHDSISLFYHRMIKSLNFYKLVVEIYAQQKNEQVLQYINQFTFKLNNLRRVSISSPFEIENLMVIDQACESFSHSPILESINFQLFDSYDTQICRQKQNYNYPNVDFFKRLDKLKYLELVNINIPINQDIIKSLEHFLKVSTQLRSLSFSRNQYYYQYDTNYTGFFESATLSSSLQHLKIDLKMENTKVYQEIPLDTFEELKNKHFYLPFNKFISQKNQQLNYIEYDEDILNKEGIEMILNTIESYCGTTYFKFDEKLLKQISIEKNLSNTLQKCNENGSLVKKTFKPPFFIYYE